MTSLANSSAGETETRASAGGGRPKEAFPDWTTFVAEIRKSFGDEAATSCLEIYFLSKKKTSLPKSLVALGAFLRDIALIFRHSMRPGVPPPSSVVAVATERGTPGPGYSTLRRPIAIMRERADVALVTHPRVKLADVTSYSLRFPGIVCLFRSVRDALPLLRRRSDYAARSVVAITDARKRFWISAWEKTLAAHRNPIVVLHNDFDMMSSAAAIAAKRRGSAICVQHGIPTDEFFPTSADTYFVWGAKSREIFQEHGSQAHLVEDALGFAFTETQYANCSAPDAPQDLVLLSQTHTPIYGIDLQTRLEELASDLVKAGVPPRILLHPREVHVNAYASIAGRASIEAPPHTTLQNPKPRALVLGFSTTAMVDAARAGHFVVGLSWSATMSLGAYEIARPPTTIHADAKAIADLYRALQTDPEARRDFLERQIEWLRRTFRSDGRFQTEMERLLADGR